MEKLKQAYLTRETAERFKIYCKNNGLLMNFVLDKIVTDWLDIKEQK